jgi:hypothetical protein
LSGTVAGFDYDGRAVEKNRAHSEEILEKKLSISEVGHWESS